MTETNISKADRILIVNTVRKYFPNAIIYHFGSRLEGKNRLFSDIDICIDAGERLDLVVLGRVKEELSLSNILYTIDISDWHRIGEDFRNQILLHSERWD